MAARAPEVQAPAIPPSSTTCSCALLAGAILASALLSMKAGAPAA
jgi:hypothetical protein